MESTQNNNMSSSVRNIMLLGATGNVGTAILAALQSHNTLYPTHPFTITVLTRASSYAKTLTQISPSANVQIVPIDSYTDSTTLTTLLRTHSIEVLISTIATFSTKDQAHLINACVSSGTVRRFFPSEYGVDTSDRAVLEKHLPPALLKHETIDLLRKASTSTSGHFTWTALITGGFFDWALALPGALTFNVPALTVDVLDGGNTIYEATNIATIGTAVVACLSSPSRFADTANQYVYINSFTTTQNEVIKLIEEYTGRSMKRNNVSAKELGKKSLAIIEANGGLQGCKDFSPTPERPYSPGSVEGIVACIFGGEHFGGINQYSRREGCLWNERLGLPRESIEETVKGVVEKLGLLKA